MMHLTYSISFASQCAMLEGKDGSRAYALAIPARLESFSHRNATLTCASARDYSSSLHLRNAVAPTNNHFFVTTCELTPFPYRTPRHYGRLITSLHPTNHQSLSRPTLPSSMHPISYFFHHWHIMTHDRNFQSFKLLVENSIKTNK